MKAAPAEIVVGPKTYTVATDVATINQAMVDEGVGLDGRTHYATQKIAIAPDMAPDHERVIVCHEVLHAVFDMTGVGRQLGEAEEGIVYRLAPALVDLLRRNPKLIAYLVES